MSKRRTRRLGFEVDKLTNSIEYIPTGEIFETEITRLGMEDVNLIPTGDWLFDWRHELGDKRREVYKLTRRDDPSVIQGLISFEDRHDHVFVHLVESAKFNIGSRKLHVGVPGNLIAFACKASFERGHQGYVTFDAKSRLIPHYELSLGAKRFWGIRMLLDSTAAYHLVRRYFKDFIDG